MQKNFNNKNTNEILSQIKEGCNFYLNFLAEKIKEVARKNSNRFVSYVKINCGIQQEWLFDSLVFNKDKDKFLQTIEVCGDCITITYNTDKKGQITHNLSENEEPKYKKLNQLRKKYNKVIELKEKLNSDTPGGGIEEFKAEFCKKSTQKLLGSDSAGRKFLNAIKKFLSVLLFFRGIYRLSQGRSFWLTEDLSKEERNFGKKIRAITRASVA